MTDKVYGVDFTNETAPTGSMTISIHNGTALRDVLLSDLVKAIPSLRVISASAPTVNDDENDGYKRGDMWLNTSAGAVYMAWVVTAGAAGWLQISNNVQDDLDGISSTQGAILYRNANDWVALSPGTAGQVLQSGGAASNPSWTTVSAGLPTGFLYGLTLSNNGTDPTNDIDIATGKARSADDGADMVLASALTKRLDAAWAVGTGNGGLDTGSIANTTYHIWLIKRSDTGVVDALFSASATSPTMPTNYDYKRRIGSVVRAGATILPFVQDGDTFMWKTPAADISVTNPGTSAVTRTLTVPAGIRVQAIVATSGGNVAGTGGHTDGPIAVYLSDLSQTDVAAATASAFSISTYSTASVVYSGGVVRVFTNTSGQIRSRVAQSTANTELYIQTHGWVDSRGRL